MKNKYYYILLVVLFLGRNVTGQTKEEMLNNLYNRFESFDYEQVIKISDDLIQTKDIFDNNQIIEIYRIRAIAQFTVYNEDSAKSSLNEIITLNENYELDPVKNSPKLIALFEDLKQVYLIEKQNKSIQDSTRLYSSPVENKEPEIYYTAEDINFSTSLYRNSITRSILIPGWGHLYLGKQNLKGTILTVSSIGLLGGMIYYIIDSNKKEKAYLQESDKALIGEKYDSFNKSYKLRNLLITGFSAIWLYTQLDLLYFSSEHFNVKSSVIPSTNRHSDLELMFVFGF